MGPLDGCTPQRLHALVEPLRDPADFWLGFPFNIVQFTMLQEIMAGWIGVDVGSYHHLSDSLHIYPEHEDDLRELTPAESALNTDDFTAVERAQCEKLVADIADRLDSIIGSEPEDIVNGHRKLHRSWSEPLRVDNESWSD